MRLAALSANDSWRNPMEDFVNHICERFGIDKAKAMEIATHLQSQGHDLPNLMKGGITMDKMHSLLGDQAGSILAGIPGVGNLLGGIFGGGDQPTAVAAVEPSTDPANTN